MNLDSSIQRFTPQQQGSGAFDGGKITEIKPIPFPQEGGGSLSIGPLFYWAWATAHGDGKIPMHPHQGFEILSYALEGEIGHSDTLGTKSRVAKGGAQVMQTGSGVSHQEEMFGDRTNFFQIWFEPDLRAAMSRQPTYAEFSDDDFPHETAENGVITKFMIAQSNAEAESPPAKGPVSLVADVSMIDVFIPAGVSHTFDLEADRFLAAVAVKGTGTWQSEQKTSPIETRDFTILQREPSFNATAGEEGLRLVIVEGAREVPYPLYSGR